MHTASTGFVDITRQAFAVFASGICTQLVLENIASYNCPPPPLPLPRLFIIYIVYLLTAVTCFN